MRYRKEKRWISDTKIARKLYSVLDSKAGEILIEVEIPDTLYNNIRDIAHKMALQYSKNVEKQLFMSPKQYQKIADNLDSEGKFDGIEVLTSSYASDNMIYMQYKKDTNNGNK